MKILIIIQIYSIKFFIFLRAELNRQWPITESAGLQIKAIRQHRTKQTKWQQNHEQWIN
jgi:hypothetical protein